MISLTRRRLLNPEAIEPPGKLVDGKAEIDLGGRAVAARVTTFM